MAILKALKPYKNESKTEFYFYIASNSFCDKINVIFNSKNQYNIHRPVSSYLHWHRIPCNLFFHKAQKVFGIFFSNYFRTNLRSDFSASVLFD